MSDHIVYLIQQAEKEYHEAIENAVAEAKKYVDESKKKQSDYINELENEWYTFEKAENEKLERALSEAEKKIEMETARSKEQLRFRQRSKIDVISDRLKSEVLSLYGHR